MNNKTFAEMLSRLEEISKLLDGGEASLEESLELFEEASKLIKECNAKLTDARLKITEIAVGSEENVNE